MPTIREPKRAAPTDYGTSPDPYRPQSYVRLEHPDWSHDASIYQLNTRQFTSEGTFSAAEAHLPRLKKLGADIIWLMPVHPIGVERRKGLLGSPYSVRDYLSVNPELGTLSDLKHFVGEAHRLGMHVILDWVANHTSWDNELRNEHPDWYARDYSGNFRPTPWWDWTDIIDLDYSRPALRKYMTDAMKYWVREVNVDGFRCDVAGFVPTDFWNNVRRELERIKPVFMLAEWESRDLHAEAFDATYAWTWWDAVHSIVNGQSDLEPLLVYYSWNEKAYPREAYRMTFVSNHDKNSWEGTQFELFGDGLEAAIVLSVVGEGMPLIYSGQEAGNPRRLPFFDRSPIRWQPHRIGDLYRDLLALRKFNTALWNGEMGARMVRVPNSAPSRVLSFIRQNDQDKVFVAINFSDERRKITFAEPGYRGSYRDFTTGDTVSADDDFELDLPPWDYRVYVRSHARGAGYQPTSPTSQYLPGQSERAS